MAELDLKYYIKLVNEKVSIEQLLSHYGIYAQKGRFSYRCPFHGTDKKPSASISKGFFHCFTCGKSWDIPAFIKEYENLPTMGKAVRLADTMFSLQLFKPLNWKEKKEQKQRAIARKKYEQRVEKARKIERKIRDFLYKRLRHWENISEKNKIIYRKELYTDKPFVYIKSIKNIEFINWVLDVLDERLHPICIYDYMYGTNKREILNKIYKEKINIKEFV